MGVNFITYFITMFAIISRGTLKHKIYFLGFFSYIVSYILAFFMLDFKSFLLFVLLSYLLIRFLVSIIIDWVEDKLFPYRKQVIAKKADELGVDPDDLKERAHINSFKNDDEIFNNVMENFKKRKRTK